MTSAILDATPDTAVLGSTYPRLYTPPLIEGPAGPCGCGCAHTRATTYGFAVINFAEYVLEEPLDPWQAWLVIHAGELLPDGRPRFRRVLVLVARQNGKTHLLKVLALYWLFVACVGLVVGMSTNLDYAREAWQKSIADIRASEALIEKMPAGKGAPIDDELPEPGGIREANGQECITTAKGSRYKIAASNRKGGRSLTINRLISDEVREHRDWSAYNASYNAMAAVADAQAWFISNAGDDGSVVLLSLRKSAESGLDRRLGRFEWSAPDGAKVTDVHAQAAANPNLGRRLDHDSIAGAAATAEHNGGEEEAGFRTEVLCQHVRRLNAAIDPGAWHECGNADGDLDDYRGRIALCLDVAPDGRHATLMAAAVIRPGVVRLDVVKAWDGVFCTKKVRADLPGLLAKIKPKTLGWFPNGPAAVLAAELSKVKRPGWPPRGCKVEEIRQDTPAVCMGFAAYVGEHAVEHTNDPLLDAHALDAEKLRSGSIWVFSRKGEGHCDGAYAAAGADHLARTLPPGKSMSTPVTPEVADELARMRAARTTDG